MSVFGIKEGPYYKAGHLLNKICENVFGKLSILKYREVSVNLSRPAGLGRNESSTAQGLYMYLLIIQSGGSG